MSATLTTCPACHSTTPNDDCESCFPIAPPRTVRCLVCKDTGLALAIEPADDDFPYYHAGLAYTTCDCPAGERLRDADRDHDLEDCLDRQEIACVGPVWAPRVVAGEPMGLEGMEV